MVDFFNLVCGRSIGFTKMKSSLIVFLAYFINLIENSSFLSLPNKVANVANIWHTSHETIMIYMYDAWTTTKHYELL